MTIPFKRVHPTLLFGLFLLPLALLAQNPRGGLQGFVQDTSGARVQSARIVVQSTESSVKREVQTNNRGEIRLEDLQSGAYQITVTVQGFAEARSEVRVNVSSVRRIIVPMKPGATQQTVNVEAQASSTTAQPIDPTSTVHQSIITSQDLLSIPLAHHSFANISYLAPMTEPVEPSDPTKARMTAVSFGGSSGLNVDLSVDGGDNNDDYIGGFLQNFSPDAMQEFTVRTAQFDADTSRTNGGSVVIGTRRGTDNWHGDLAAFYRNKSLNARNPLDNPAPNPKQPFSRENGVFALGGPLLKERLWFFTSFEYINEDASVGYSNLSLGEFNALAQLAELGQIPGVISIPVPASVSTPFHDSLFSTRFDLKQSERSFWFLRGAFDLNRTKNDLVHEGALPSTGFTTTSNYFSVLLSNQFQFAPNWIGNMVLQASGFHHVKTRNSQLGFGLAFPFSSTTLTTSGFETFGNNQFATPITAFPVNRDQQKYQFRYDVTNSHGNHLSKFGINFIHEPVLGGRLSDSGEVLHILPENPSFYVSNSKTFTGDFNDTANQKASCDPNSPPVQGLVPDHGRV